MIKLDTEAVLYSAALRGTLQSRKAPPHQDIAELHPSKPARLNHRLPTPGAGNPRTQHGACEMLYVLNPSAAGF